MHQITINDSRHICFEFALVEILTPLTEIIDIKVLHHARQIIRPLVWTPRNSFQQPKEMETSLRGELPDAVAILERKHPGSDSFAFRFELYKATVFKS